MKYVCTSVAHINWFGLKIKYKISYAWPEKHLIENICQRDHYWNMFVQMWHISIDLDWKLNIKFPMHGILMYNSVRTGFLLNHNSLKI